MSRRVPFLSSSKLGEKLRIGVQKVLGKSGVELVDYTASTESRFVLASPLNSSNALDLTNQLGLSTAVTSTAAAKWYPSSLYGNVKVVALRNIYNLVNPTHKPHAQSAVPLPSTTVIVKDNSILEVQENQKDTERAFQSFFDNEARQSLTETLRIACKAALANRTDRNVITIAHKPLGALTSPFDEMFAQIVKYENDSRADEFRSNNLVLELSPVSQWPKLVVFPETTPYLVCPPTSAGLQMEQLVIGIAGGSGMAAQQLTNLAQTHTVFTCTNAEDNENPTGLLLSTAELLKALDLESDAQKLLSAIEKTFEAKIFTKDLPGGSADLESFIDAVSGNL